MSLVIALALLVVFTWYTSRRAEREQRSLVRVVTTPDARGERRRLDAERP